MIQCGKYKEWSESTGNRFERPSQSSVRGNGVGQDDWEGCESGYVGLEWGRMRGIGSGVGLNDTEKGWSRIIERALSLNERECGLRWSKTRGKGSGVGWDGIRGSGVEWSGVGQDERRRRRRIRHDMAC